MGQCMGNASKKLAAKCTFLNRDEQKYIANTFRQASKNKDTLKEDELIVSGTIDAVSLEKYWGPSIDPRMSQYLTNYLFGIGPSKTDNCTFNKFAELYVYNVRGTADERIGMLTASLGLGGGDRVEVPYQLIKEYCECIASTYIKVVKSTSSGRAYKWIEKGFRGKACHIQALGESLAATIDELEKQRQHYSEDELAKWIHANTLLQAMTELVFVTLYGVEVREDEDGNRTGTSFPCLLPRPDGIDPLPDYPAFIDLSHIVWLNSHLPQEYQHKWRFLFSSHIHGQSFSTMAGRIQDQGPSLLIIEDSNGHIFGGYAPEPWVLGPNFHGTERSFLFALAPKMRHYSATTFNNHYQYINMQTKTLPNGLLMGGQFEFAGIWINASPFGDGSSAESCITYRGYRQLSKETKFHIRSIEVWGVGERPLSVKESDEREQSILDRNPEAKAVLEMAGRQRHSEGLREPDS